MSKEQLDGHRSETRLAGKWNTEILKQDNEVLKLVMISSVPATPP